MIPIRDTTPTRNYPVVNSVLIAVNVLVFLFQLAQGAGFERFVTLYGLVPARYTHPSISQYFSFGQQVFSFVSFMFLHGGFWHLLGNMWFLHIFGDNVEDRLGPARYLIFYLFCGLASGGAHFLLNLDSTVPTIGASGAIAGVMGAYFILYPSSRILTLIPILIFPWFIEIPAFVFLGIWFLIQFFNATGSSAAGGIAWWAHVGGFVAGILFLKLFQSFPASGLTSRIRPLTTKQKTHRLQVVRPVGPATDMNLYDTLNISAYEARVGAQKLISINWGIRKRLVRLAIPAGLKQGSRLRLQGMGRAAPDGTRGDLYLAVRIS